MRHAEVDPGFLALHSHILGSLHSFGNTVSDHTVVSLIYMSVHMVYALYE